MSNNENKPDHIEDVRGMVEPVYAFRRKGQDSFCTCDFERYEELSQKENLFETTIFYTRPAEPCARCAELGAEVARLLRDQDQYGTDKVAIQKQAWLESDKQRQINELRQQLAALEAENKSLKELFTVDKYGTTMADMYLDLKAENARLNATVAEMQPMLGEQQATIAQQAERIKELENKLNESKSNN